MHRRSMLLLALSITIANSSCLSSPDLGPDLGEESLATTVTAELAMCEDGEVMVRHPPKKDEQEITCQVKFQGSTPPGAVSMEEGAKGQVICNCIGIATCEFDSKEVGGCFDPEWPTTPEYEIIGCPDKMPTTARFVFGSAPCVQGPPACQSQWVALGKTPAAQDAFSDEACNDVATQIQNDSAQVYWCCAPDPDEPQPPPLPPVIKTGIWIL